MQLDWNIQFGFFIVAFDWIQFDGNVPQGSNDPDSNPSAIGTIFDVGSLAKEGRNPASQLHPSKAPSFSQTFALLVASTWIAQ